MHVNSVLLTQDGINMAKQNNPKPKQRAVGGLAGLSKARAEADKRIKAMTPAQRKAYQSQNKKNAVKAVATAASFIPAGRAIKGASMAKKAVSTSIKKSVEKKSLKAANAPSKNQAASDSGRRYMGQKFMKVEDAGKDRYGQQKVSIKRNTEKLKEATTPRTPGGTVRLNPRFAKNLRKGR
jgi:hypothetical protein